VARQRRRLVWPIVASFTVCDSGFPRIRFVLDPSKPAITGTRRVDGALLPDGSE
jgi:hypothetical protein